MSDQPERASSAVSMAEDARAQLLVAEGLSFEFSKLSEPVLRDVHMALEPGERVALMGHSGSGKSTLLHILSGVLSPSRGAVSFAGKPLSSLSRDDRARIRLRDFGFVFQFAELLPDLTLKENVELPIRLLGRAGTNSPPSSSSPVEDLLDAMGIAHVQDRLPSKVSGGERQRAAIARALVHRPAVIFADEPTGALDETTGSTVMSALLWLAETHGSTVLVVTHNPAVAGTMDRTLSIRDGRILD